MNGHWTWLTQSNGVSINTFISIQGDHVYIKWMNSSWLCHTTRWIRTRVLVSGFYSHYPSVGLTSLLKLSACIFQLIVLWWRNMPSYILVNILSANRIPLNTLKFFSCIPVMGSHLNIYRPASLGRLSLFYFIATCTCMATTIVIGLIAGPLSPSAWNQRFDKGVVFWGFCCIFDQINSI